MILSLISIGTDAFLVMRTTFTPILHLEIWHDYFLGQPVDLDSLPNQYDVSEAIALIPTSECEKTLRNLRWLFRSQPYGALLLAQVVDKANDILSPIVPIDLNVRLTFWMMVRDSNFSNYTNLPLTSTRDRLYYFSNLPGKEVGAFGKNKRLFLTQPHKEYSADNNYCIGDIVVHPNSELSALEAATYIPNSSSLSQEIDNKKFEREWIRLPSNQYVSEQDQLRSQGLSRTVPLTLASPGDTVRLANLNGQETIAFQVPNAHPPQTDLTVSLNLADYPLGYYKIWHNKKQIDDEFVLVDPIAGRQVFALVEISLNPLFVSQPFQILDEKDKIHPQTYRIHFRNRSTYWRYHTTYEPTDSFPENFGNFDSKTFTFTTKLPCGHFRKPSKLVYDEKHHLPAPSPTTIPKVEFLDHTLNADGSRIIKAIFTDIYL